MERTSITMPCMEQTRGTETSHYPEEEKTKVIAQVVASERARAQTGGVKASAGVVGPPTKRFKKLEEGFGKNPRRA